MMGFTLKRRTQAASRNGDPHLRRASSSALRLPPVVFSSSPARHLKRRPLASRVMELAAIFVAVFVVLVPALTLSILLSFIYYPESADEMVAFFYTMILPEVPVRRPQEVSLPIAPVDIGDGMTVALLIPVLSEILTNVTPTELLHTLLGPLLEAEASLCHRASDGAAVRATVHAVVVARTSAAAVLPAVRGLLAAGWPAEGAVLTAGGAGGALTPGVRWRSWELSAAAVRAALRLTIASDDGGARCLADSVTVVANAVGGDGAVLSEEPADTLEVLVDAGLRTRGGGVGSHFIVLPSFLSGSRMAYTEPGDETEERHAGTGLVDALLRTATARNGGRVAAAQCTILGTWLAEPPKVLEPAPVPAELTWHVLDGLHVLDKGGWTASTHTAQMLLPFLSRRMHGYRATDQRASWEEVVDAVSLHCGVFHRALYNAVGGLAAVHADASLKEAIANSRDQALALRVHSLVLAPDRGGWALSLRMQEMYPDWQVWGSRAVAVLREDSTQGRTSRLPAIDTLYVPLLSLWDAYGQSMYATTTRLQARRSAVPWRLRGLVNASLQWAAREVAMLPPLINYYTDFVEPCCGLNREAMSYIRPLLDRYAIRVFGTFRVCPKPGDAVLAAPYAMMDSVLRQDASMRVRAFFYQRHKTRAQINFQHWRGHSYRWGLSGIKSKVPTVSIGRSLSELSNIPRSWVEPMRQRVDEVWATADFFATIYRRNGINAAKIRVVPEAVDVYDYDPANYVRQPVMLSGDAAEAGFDSEPELTPEERVRRYVFLANFKWEDRKGWDVLLGAYWDAFGPGAPPELRGRTTLVIKTKFEATFARGVTCENVVRFIEAWGMLGSLQGMRSMKDFPHVVLLCGQMSTTQVTQLYANADAFVFPSKAEGWGLPATEAMAMALPVLITEWGGLRRFITPDTCFRIPLDGLEEIEPGSPYGYEQGMKMAVPSRAKTAELMRYVLQHPEHARRVGRRARALIAREMSEEAVADRMDQLLLNLIAQRV